MGQGSEPVIGGPVDLSLSPSWLAAHGAGGLWSDSGVTVARDSAEALEALGRAGGFQSQVGEGLEALPTAVAESGELRLRRLEALARWGSDAATNNLLLAEGPGRPERRRRLRRPAALRRRPRDQRPRRARPAAAGRPIEANRAWACAQDAAEFDGGWSWQEGGTSSVAATLEVALAARVPPPPPPP